MRLEQVDTAYFMRFLRQEVNTAPQRTFTLELLQGGGETDANVIVRHAKAARAWRVGPGGLSRANDQTIVLMVAQVLYGVIDGDREAVNIQDSYNLAGGTSAGWMVLEITSNKLTRVAHRPAVPAP